MLRQRLCTAPWEAAHPKSESWWDTAAPGPLQDPQVPPVTLQSQPAPGPERSDSAPKGKCHRACSESTEKLWFVPRIKPPAVTRAGLFVPPSLSRQFLEIKMSSHQAKSKHISVPEYVRFFISSYFFATPTLQPLPRLSWTSQE